MKRKELPQIPKTCQHQLPDGSFCCQPSKWHITWNFGKNYGTLTVCNEHKNVGREVYCKDEPEYRKQSIHITEVSESDYYVNRNK